MAHTGGSHWGSFSDNTNAGSPSGGSVNSDNSHNTGFHNTGCNRSGEYDNSWNQTWMHGDHNGASFFGRNDNRSDFGRSDDGFNSPRQTDFYGEPHTTGPTAQNGKAVIVMFCVFIAIVASIIGSAALTVFVSRNQRDFNEDDFLEQIIQLQQNESTPEKLSPYVINEIEGTYTDETGMLIGNEAQTAVTGLEYFYSETGIPAYVWLTESIDNDDIQSWLKDKYYELFSDEGHLLVLILLNENKYRAQYTVGDEAYKLFNDDVGEAFLNNLDIYFSDDDYCLGDKIYYSFTDTSYQLMSGQLWNEEVLLTNETAEEPASTEEPASVEEPASTEEPAPADEPSTSSEPPQAVATTENHVTQNSVTQSNSQQAESIKLDKYIPIILIIALFVIALGVVLLKNRKEMKLTRDDRRPRFDD